MGLKYLHGNDTRYVFPLLSSSFAEFPQSVGAFSACCELFPVRAAVTGTNVCISTHCAFV